MAIHYGLREDVLPLCRNPNYVSMTHDWTQVDCPTCRSLAPWAAGPPAPDPVHRPAHYNWHPSGVECIEIAGAFDYFLGNVIKYVWRADHKGKPVEDLRKAQTYLAKAIEQREAES